MPSNRSARDWAARRAREMKKELDPIEDTARALSILYLLASQEIEDEAMKLARRFQLRYNLTEKEAWRLLETGIDPEDIDALIKELKRDPKNQELAAQLESQAYAARINRLKETQAAVDQVTTKIYTEAGPMMEQALEQITRRSYYENIFEVQQRAGVGFPVTPLDEARVKAIINKPWSGKNFSQTLWGNTKRLAEKVKEEITVGVLTGKTPHKMAEAIEEEFHTGASNARRLIRTEASHAANDIQLQTYEDLGVERYIYVAILDLRTSAICRSLDMKRFPVSEARAGENYPPMHPYCRSTTIAELPEELMEGMTRKALDPATGDIVEVPMDMNYDQWYEKFVKEPVKQSKIGSFSSASNRGIIFSSESVERMSGTAITSERPIPGSPISEEEYERIREKAEAAGIELVDDDFKGYCGDPEVLDQMIDDITVSRSLWGEKSQGMTLRIGYKPARNLDDYAWVDRRTGVIYLNKEVYDDTRYLERDYAAQVAEGRFVKGTTYRSIPLHEAGHKIARRDRTLYGDIISRLSEYGDEKEVIRANFSQYALVYERGRYPELIPEILSATLSGDSAVKAMAVYLLRR